MKDPARAAVNRWLNTIAADVINAQLGRGALRPSSNGGTPTGVSRPARPSRRERLTARWRLAEPHVALLPPQQREVVAMRFRDGLSYRSIAAKLDVPLGTVHSRLARGRQLLDASVEPAGASLDDRRVQQDGGPTPDSSESLSD